MAKKSCKKGYYYCYASKKCKKIPMGYYIGGGGWLRKEEEKSEDTEGKKKNGNGANGDGSGNGDSSGGSNGGGVSEGWSAKYKRSIDCNNPKGFSQRAHCQGRKKVNEATMSPAQKRKDTMLKKKYDKSDMKQNMIDQYGKEEGTKIYFATIRKQAMKEEKKGDHEVAMAQTQLKKSEENIKKLRKALGTKEKNIPAWVQAKITDTEHNTDAASSYMDEGKRDGKSAKSKDYSLRDWFKGGGWVQAGGKYDGKPCAKQPGQKTKPFCRDADDRASMSKDERNRRAAKKRKEDPNPNRKGKAKMVSASYSNWRADLEHLDEGLGLGLAAGAAALAAAPYLAKKFFKPKADKSLQRGRNELHLKGNPIGAGARGLDKQSYEPEGEMVEQTKPTHTFRQRMGYDMTVPSDVYQGRPDLRRSLELRGSDLSRQDRKYFKGGGGYARMQQDNQTMQQVIDRGRKNQERLSSKMVNTANWTDDQGRRVYAGSPTMRFNTQKNSYEPEGDLVDEGKKDACYHKVKSRYSVWPSAYASGALVKCREVGAKNWGNKTKKESYEFSNWRDDFQAMEIETFDIIKAEPLQSSQTPIDEKAQKCWKGYEKKGTKKMFGKTYNNCVKKEEFDLQEKKSKKDACKGKVKRWQDSDCDGKWYEKGEDVKEDWQKANRKDGVDGMSQSSVNAYKRENPGSKLQTAVTEKNPTGKRKNRRKSFCSRSNGQRKMHNIDCSKTPDKKICKARKRWRC